jgi:hypothetical protein
MISHTEIQLSSSYTIQFSAESDTYPLEEYPTSYFIVTIYRNGEMYYVSTGVPQGSSFPYTFNEVSSEGIEYTVSYIMYSSAENNLLLPPDEMVEPVVFTILEYKPTFSLPVVTCAPLNQEFNFFPVGLKMNENVCPETIPPGETGLEQYDITYKMYEFNMANAQYELKDTYTVNIDEEDDLDENGELLNPENYSYKNGWVPNKLTMVKFVVTVTNCSTTTEHSTVFPICGGWKIRRLACGDYRIYNYKNTSISYTLYKGVGTEDSVILAQNISIPAFSYLPLVIEEDNIYRVVADNITQYIFNYCNIEECMLDLHKRILLDETLCDECKMDKVLYQKALRLLPTYETWKKLLDKDWVYDMQYKTADVTQEISRLYEAKELYLELIKLCEDCGDTKKKCSC